MSRLKPVPSAIVYYISVLVTAAASGNSSFRSWPSPPPVSGNQSADCLGIIVDAAEFALWLSPRVTADVDRILCELFKWDQPEIDAYLHTVVEQQNTAAAASWMRCRGQSMTVLIMKTT